MTTCPADLYSMMQPRLSFVSLLLSCALSTSTALMAQEPYWNQFRGPHGDGTSLVADPPIEFGEKKNVMWKTPIHGKGWSSPVVWDQQVWMTTATEDGKQLYAVCVNLQSGSIDHDILVFEVPEPEFCHATNSYASCTPVAEEDRVFVHFGTYGTACLDNETGEKLWERRDLHCDHFRGPASSPIVLGDRLYIHFDGIDVQYVVALDKYTGKTLWKTDRDIDYGTDDGDWKKAYGTPAVITVGDQQQIVCPAASETITYHPETGKELWRVVHGGMNASARPIFQYGLVYINAGQGDRSLVAVKPPDGAENVEPRIVWETGKTVPNRASVIVSQGALFMISDSGVATCLAARSGQTFWTRRLGGEFWSSPVHAGGRIYSCNKEGTVFVIKAEPVFEVLAENHFPAGFNASPAIAGDSLILRSFTHLYRIGN